MASPSRLKPNTARLMVMLGKTTSQGDTDTSSPPVMASILPHEGMSGGVPTPRKLRDASTTMATPRFAVANTMYGAMQFGMMWRRMIRELVAPKARAASM